MTQFRTILWCALISVIRGVIAWNGRRSFSGLGYTSIHSFEKHRELGFLLCMLGIYAGRVDEQMFVAIAKASMKLK